MNRAPLPLLFAALTALAFALAASIGGGLWDPVEIELITKLTAEGARPSPAERLLLGALALGAEEIRLIPLAFGFLTLLLTFGFTALVSDRRAAFYALVLLGSTPLFLLNTRLAIGAAPAIFGQLVAGVSFYLLLALDEERPSIPLSRALPLALFGAALSVSLAGVLLGLMPGLLAALAARIDGSGWRAFRQPLAAGALLLAGLLSAILFGVIIEDQASFSLWLGGSASGDPPPAFHTLIERAFHGLLPISAFIPALLAFALFRGDEHEPNPSEASARTFARSMLLFAAFSYLSATIFEARYGVTTFLAAPAVAIACAVAFRSLEQRAAGEPLIAIASLLLIALGVRDLSLFPDSLLGALPLRGETLPEGTSLRAALGAPLIGFALLAAIIIGGDYEREPRPLNLKERLSSRRAKLALILSLALYLIVALIGLIHTFAPGALPLRSIIGFVASIVALALPGLVLTGALLVALRRLIARLPSKRGGLLAIAALPLALSLSLIVIPRLDAHLSPKRSLALLEEIHHGAAPIYALDQNPSALSVYTSLEIDTERSVTSIHRALPRERRIFLLFPQERLAELDRELWIRARRHLHILSDENPSTLLATNLPLEGYADKNPLVPIVLDEPIEVAHPVHAKLKGGYELLGYEIVYPRGALEAGRKFTLRLFWTVERRDTRSYDVFVHLDGPSGRIHGDHPPLRGLYSTRDFSAGDFLIDEREIRVPGHYGPGIYTLHVGLYRGKDRAEIIEGPSDGNDRVIAGEVELR